MSEPAGSSVAAAAGGCWRAEVEIAARALLVRGDDGRCDQVWLDGASVEVADAALAGRFVSLAIIRGSWGRCDLVSAPEEGAIAPRAAQVRPAPAGAAILARASWETVAAHLVAGGDLAGRSIDELAALARLAAPELAVAVGRRAAEAAVDAASVPGGPLRGGGDVRARLRPLEVAARESALAAAALAAARLHLTVLESARAARYSAHST